MPELPEVQTIINYLKTKILSQKIKSIEILNEKFLKNTTKLNFINLFKDQEFISIERKGKYIIFNFNNNWSCITHLRMEGKFFVDENRYKKRKHDYLVFELSNNLFLTYNDTRQFGTFHIIETKNINELKELQKVAKDPFEKDFDINELVFKIKKSNKNIKTILLDQSIIGGIGNIYANEILFDTKINPFKKGFELEQEQINQIHKSSIKILKTALKNNGTTIHSYSFGEGNSGNFTSFLKVQSREGKKCFDCDEKIIRVKNQGRSIFYCKKCQVN